MMIISRKTSFCSPKWFITNCCCRFESAWKWIFDVKGKTVFVDLTSFLIWCKCTLCQCNRSTSFILQLVIKKKNTAWSALSLCPLSSGLSSSTLRSQSQRKKLNVLRNLWYEFPMANKEVMQIGMNVWWKIWLHAVIGTCTLSAAFRIA